MSKKLQKFDFTRNVFTHRFNTVKKGFILIVYSIFFIINTGGDIS